MTERTPAGLRHGAAPLLVAAAITVGLLGLAWAPGDLGLGQIGPGTVMTGTAIDVHGDLVLTTTYIPGYYEPGVPGPPITGYQGSPRVLLVPAAAALVVAALHRTRRTRVAAQVAIGALVVAAVLGVGHGAAVPALLSLLAAALAAGVLWPGLATRARSLVAVRPSVQAT